VERCDDTARGEPAQGAGWRGCEGIPCPRCHENTQVRTHAAITPILLRQSYYYYYGRWYVCLNQDCKAIRSCAMRTAIYPDAELNDADDAAARLQTIREQLLREAVL
jgi:hypothetical protein